MVSGRRAEAGAPTKPRYYYPAGNGLLELVGSGRPRREKAFSYHTRPGSVTLISGLHAWFGVGCRDEARRSNPNLV